MTDPVTIIECPRDAWQGLFAHIPADRKAAYLSSLIHAGFTHLDAVSFVSPAAVPQMTDSETVLQSFDIPATVEIIGIVVNRKGAERAIATGRVSTLGFPYSISAEFLHRNQHQTPAESQAILQDIVSLADHARRNIVAYISMAFGNPYGEPWSVDHVVAACDHLATIGVHQISLADTVGVATPAQIADVFTAARGTLPSIELGVHLHARPDAVASSISAAYHAGCRRFDAALGGLGGCPFAQDDLVGNIPTELLIQTLTQLGAQLPPLDLRHDLLAANAQIAQQFGTSSHDS
ncbi:MAG: hydroxymethylglutaryl-CoA lyase [Acidobacteriaceae bacterium]